jgi:translation initiation factor IF-2
LAKNLRVHELAKELGLTNKEAVDLCLNMGIDIKGHSSSIIEAQADRVRRRAERDGLVRDEQPEEVKPVKKAAVKKVAAKKEGDAEGDEPKPAKKAAAKKAPAKKAAARPPRKAGKPKRGSVPPMMPPMGGGGMGPMGPMGM